MRDVTARFPDCTPEKLSKGWSGARGWKSSSELLVLEDFHFRELKVWIEVNKVYRVAENEVVLTGLTIEKYTDQEEEGRMRLGKRTF
jgi:hypothetical protein